MHTKRYVKLNETDLSVHRQSERWRYIWCIILQLFLSFYIFLYQYYITLRACTHRYMIFQFSMVIHSSNRNEQFKRWRGNILSVQIYSHSIPRRNWYDRDYLYSSQSQAAYKLRAACISIRGMQFVYVEWQVAYPRCKTMIDPLVQPARNHIYSRNTCIANARRVRSARVHKSDRQINFNCSNVSDNNSILRCAATSFDVKEIALWVIASADGE